MRRELKAGERAYRYHVVSAHYAGVDEHPQTVIRRLAPSARNFEAHSVADCWLFTAPAIESLPAYVIDITKFWQRAGVSRRLS